MPLAGGVLTALLLTVAPSGAGAQQAVRIPTDRLGRRAAETLREVPVISQQPERSTVQVQDNGILLRRGEVAAVKDPDAFKEVPGPVGDLVVDPGRPAPEVDLPFFATDLRLVTPDADLSGAWVLRPVYKVANRMRWVPEAGVFQGALFLAIEDSLRRNESRPLPTPVRFQLITEADAVDPSELSFEHTNFPLRRIEISARSATDSLRVHLVGEFDVNGSDIWVPVVPYLEVEPTPLRVQGWGVQTARVVVRVLGTTAGTPIPVVVTTTQGEIDATDLELGPSGSGVVTLRSSGSGEAVLRASAPGLEDATTTIRYVWPWVFLLAALLGGVFGGAAATIVERRADASTSVAAGALKGLLVGVLAALAWYALGVNLLGLDLGVPRQNELAVFTIAALAGYFGVPRMKAPGARKAEPATAGT